MLFLITLVCSLASGYVGWRLRGEWDSQDSNDQDTP